MYVSRAESHGIRIKLVIFYLFYCDGAESIYLQGRIKCSQRELL